MPPKKQKKPSLVLAKKKTKKQGVKKTSRKKTVQKKPSITKNTASDQNVVLVGKTESILLEHPAVSHLALSGHRSRFEHTWIVVGCFSLMFASLLFLSSQIKAAQDTGGGLQAAQVSAIVAPNPYNTKQKSFFEKWYASLDATTKLSLQSGLVLALLLLISSLLLIKHHPKNSSAQINAQPGQQQSQGLSAPTV